MTHERPKRHVAPLTSAIALMTGFKREERGNVTLFSLFLFIMMVGITGVSLDYSRAERDRTVMQNTLDRAVLAAADLDQERPAADVVADYFEMAGLSSTLKSVNVDEGLNYKSISVEAEVSTTAPYLDMMTRWMQTNRNLGEARGMDPDDPNRVNKDNNYNEYATRIAQQTVTADGVEIQLERQRDAADELAQYRADTTKTITTSVAGAAEERVSNVEISMVLDVSGSMGSNNRMTRLKTAAKEFIDTVLQDDTEDLVSVNIVPYDEHVSLGSGFYNTLRDELSVVHRHNYSHCIEFEDSEFGQTAINWNATYDQMQHTRLWSNWGFQCSTSYHDRIQVLSQDNTELKDQIDDLQASGNTHIFLGMKWAAALLEPSFNVVVDDLIADGLADPAFDDRPAAFDDVETIKTIVLMTDGVNTSSYRVQDWAYSRSSHYVHWNNWGIRNYLNAYVNSWQHNQYYYTKYWGSFGDTLLSNICTAAKTDGIVIWSIGFEVDDHGADVMRACASSPSHFFRVEGIEISDAFDAIARQINQLRLTQ